MREKPKYIQIEEDLKLKIQEGLLKTGDKLETEMELAKKFDVSRLTINKALSRLATEGLLDRIPGKGTFIKSNSFTADLNTVGSFTSYVKAQHHEVDSKIIEYKLLDANEVPDSIRQKLEVKNNSVHYFIRVRTVDKKPVVVMTSYICESLIPNFDISILNGSLYDYFDKENLPRISYDSKLSAITPNDFLAKNLKVDKCTALLKHEHVTFTTNKVPLEYCEAIYIGNRYAYEFKGMKIKKL